MLKVIGNISRSVGTGKLKVTRTRPRTRTKTDAPFIFRTFYVPLGA